MVDVIRQAGIRAPEEPLVRSPQSIVSPAEAARPYQAVAEAVGFIGQRMEEASIPFQEAAGADAVTLDENGEPRVAWRIELTAGDRAHNAAARQAALALGKNVIVQKAADIRRKNEGDIVAFQGAMRDFENVFGKEDRLLRPFFRTEILNQTQGHIADMARQQEARDYRTLASAWAEEEALARDRRQLLILNGGAGTEEVAKLTARIDDIRNQRVAHPKFAYSEREKAVDDERDGYALKGAQLVWSIRSAVRSGGTAQAEALLRQLEEDPDLPMRAEERRSLIALGRDALREVSEDQRIARTEIRNRAGAVITTLRSGAAIDDGVIDTLMNEAASAGDASTVTRLTTARALNKTLREFGPLSLGEKARRATEAGAGLTAPAGRGGPIDIKAVARAIIGVESNWDPNARNSRSTATGLGQFLSSTWLSMVQRYRPDLASGKSEAQILALRTDPKIAIEMTERYAAENAERLRDAGLPVTAGTVYLSHFAGSAGARALLRADPTADAATLMARASGGRSTAAEIVRANPFMAGMSASDLAAWADRKAGGRGALAGEQAALFNAYRANIADDLARRVPTIIEALDRGVRLTEEDALELRSAFQVAPNPQLQSKLASAVAKAEGADAALGKTGPQASAILSRLETAIRDGADDPVVREFQEGFAAANTKLQEDLRKDWVEAVPRIRFTAPENVELAARASQPLQFDQPDILGAQLGERARLSRKVQERFSSAPGSLLRPAEVQALRSLAVNGSPGQLQSVLLAIANTDPDHLEPTLRAPGLSGAISALTLTKNPQKYRAVMVGLDVLSRRNDGLFADVFKGDVVDRLQDYQAGLDSDDDAELKKRLETYNDGRQGVVRDEMIARAGTRASNISQEEIVSRLWNASDRPGFVGRMVGEGSIRAEFAEQAAVPAGTNIALLADFRTILQRRYLATGSMEIAEEQTIQQLKGLWTFSRANNGQLMKHAPERFYPTIENSHDWIREQIQQDLKERVWGRDIEAAPVDLADPALAAENPNFSVPAAPAATMEELDFTRGDPAAAPRRDVMTLPRAPAGAQARPIPGQQPNTERPFVKYTIVATPKTQEDIAAKRPPGYMITFVHPVDGRIHVATWRGDLDKAMEPIRNRISQAVELRRSTDQGLREMNRNARSPLDILNRQREE